MKRAFTCTPPPPARHSGEGLGLQANPGVTSKGANSHCSGCAESKLGRRVPKKPQQRNGGMSGVLGEVSVGLLWYSPNSSLGGPGLLGQVTLQSL